MLQIHRKAGRRGYGVIIVKLQARGRLGYSERTLPNAQLSVWNVALGVWEAGRHWGQVRHLCG